MKSVSDLYAELAISFIHNSGSLGILSDCDAETWTGGPTWAPNWASPTPYNGHYLRGNAGSSRGPFEFAEEQRLRVKAVFCGEIERCSTTGSKDASFDKIASLIQDWAPNDLLATTCPGGTNALDAYILLLTNYEVQERVLDTGFIKTQEARRLMTQIISRGAVDANVEVGTQTLPTFLSLIRHWATNRRLFETQTGHFGLGPCRAQIGDHIYSIIGCESMIVLRPFEHQKYQVVGHCKMPGFTDLEALLGPLPSGYYIEEPPNVNYMYEMWFVGSKTGVRSRKDPRLGEGHPGWLSDKRNKDNFILWENTETGERTVCDPRHSDINFLRSRGVDIKDIVIV